MCSQSGRKAAPVSSIDRHRDHVASAADAPLRSANCEIGSFQHYTADLAIKAGFAAVTLSKPFRLPLTLTRLLRNALERGEVSCAA